MRVASVKGSITFENRIRRIVSKGCSIILNRIYTRIAVVIGEEILGLAGTFDMKLAFI